MDGTCVWIYRLIGLIEEEQRTYDNIAFEMHELHGAVGNTTNIHDEVRDVLQARWRFPSLSLHGIEGAFYNPGDKTVVPAKVIGKFSIRTVPDMKPEKVTELVCKYVNDEFAKLGSKNSLEIKCSHAGNHWLSSPDHWTYGEWMGTRACICGYKRVEYMQWWMLMMQFFS